MPKYGLVGKNIGYSFSKKFFTEKFERENQPDSYANFDLATIEKFPELISDHPDLKGLNVTIPYKEKIIPFLDSLDPDAEKIGAVNTIKISEDGSLRGFNTDHTGFRKALGTYLPLQKKTALILGTGGAAKAVAYALKTLGFDYGFVSRRKKEHTRDYAALNKSVIQNSPLIINCTPLGTFPKTGEYPPIPYQYLTENHLLFDLIYNPPATEFLKHGKRYGAQTSNGLKMLELQALHAWTIWNS